jgi:8-oxo-dGTP diphosphatase
MENIQCTYRVSTKAIIKNEHDEIMFLQESSGVWDLPGGGMDQGESPREALKREIDEETGFTVDWMDDRPANFWTVRRETGSNPLKWFAFVSYEVKTSGTFKSAAKDENGVEGAIVEVKFFSTTEAATLNLHDNARAFIESLPF